MSRPWPAVGWLPLALLLSSCAGTPWGERLSGSFPPPEESVPGAQRGASPLPAPAAGVDQPDADPSAPSSPAPPNTSVPPGQNASAPPPGQNAPSPGQNTPSPGQNAPSPGRNASTSALTARPGDAPTPAAAGRPLAPKGPSVPKPPSTPAPSTSPSPSQPFPYRVTLRLPRADPSAPAEAVTRALRTAGIPFEVETIERVQAGATAPSVRPAPPPR